MAHAEFDTDDLDLESHIGEELVNAHADFSLGVLRDVGSTVHRFERRTGEFVPRHDDVLETFLKDCGTWQEPGDHFENEEDA